MLLSLLLCVGIVSGFRPNPESRGNPGDFTDADITELGALRAVAWFMERNPLPGKSAVTPGELENMKPLNATGLFKAYYKGELALGPKTKTFVLVQSPVSWPSVLRHSLPLSYRQLNCIVLPKPDLSPTPLFLES